MAVCSKCGKMFTKTCKHGKVCDECKYPMMKCMDCGKECKQSLNGKKIRCNACAREHNRLRSVENCKIRRLEVGMTPRKI